MGPEEVAKFAALFDRGILKAQALLGCSDSTRDVLRFGGRLRRSTWERLVAQLTELSSELDLPPPESSAVLHAAHVAESCIEKLGFWRPHCVAGIGIVPGELVIQLLAPRVPPPQLQTVREMLGKLLPDALHLFVIPAPVGADADRPAATAP